MVSLKEVFLDQIISNIENCKEKFKNILISEEFKDQEDIIKEDITKLDDILRQIEKRKKSDNQTEINKTNESKPEEEIQKEETQEDQITENKDILTLSLTRNLN